MNIRKSLAAVALVGALGGSAACTIYDPQRVDNLGAVECRAQVQQGIEGLLVGNKEAPDVAHTLAVSAVDQMVSEVADTPRPNSHLAADLRVLTTEAKVGARSGIVYHIYADSDRKGCTLRMTGDGYFIGSPLELPACRCEPAQG